MVRQDEKLPDLDLVLKDSPFEEALECVKRVYDSMDIKNVYDLENTPRSLTCSFCGVSTHKLIEHILHWMADPPKVEKPKVKEESKPEPDLAPLPEVKKVPKKVAAKKPAQSRKSKSGTSSPQDDKE